MGSFERLMNLPLLGLLQRLLFVLVRGATSRLASSLLNQFRELVLVLRRALFVEPNRRSMGP